jgi:hypothetical protein
MTVVEVPMALTLDAPLPADEAEANALLDEAKAMAEHYGAPRVVTRIVEPARREWRSCARRSCARRG